MVASRRPLRIMVAVVAAGIAASLSSSLFIERADRIKCASQIRAIFDAIYMDADLHHGRFPHDLDTLLARQDVGRIVLRCPGLSGSSGQPPPLGTSDYIYIDWADQPGQPEPQLVETREGESSSWSPRPALARFPLIYDRRLENHGGKGVNVILVDGTQFWDRNAAWLKNFARDHPEAHLPLPQ